MRSGLKAADCYRDGEIGRFRDVTRSHLSTPNPVATCRKRLILGRVRQVAEAGDL